MWFEKRGACFMVFTFPQTIDQMFAMLVPLLTLIIGLLYLVMPKKLLEAFGLEAVEGKPHAIGEGRSSYAGILIAFGAACLFLQEPLALQPGLNLVLALAWWIAALGIVLQVQIDGARGLGVVCKLIFALFMGGVAFLNAELVNLNFALPHGAIVEWVIFLVAGLTLILGLISLLLPAVALKILKLKPNAQKLHVVGEVRGVLAGFYTALGFACLFFNDPFIAKQFASIILAGAWLLTGIGRFISIIVDRGATLYNFAGVIFEVGTGAVLVGLILGLI